MCVNTENSEVVFTSLRHNHILYILWDWAQNSVQEHCSTSEQLQKES